LTIPVQRSTIEAVTNHPFGEQLVIVADAHLGAAPASVEEAMLDFLDAVPDLGDCLLVNGDLFDFWFAYRRVIPRKGFRVASALAALRKRVPIAMTGGNHDRWGDSFWDRDLDIQFGSDGLRLQLGAAAVWALHGDGIAEQHRSARLMHRLTRSRTGLALFRQVPVDAAFRLVDRMSGRLADSTRDHAVLDRAADAQRAWAEQQLRTDPGLGLVVMGHTHRPALTEPSPGRRYCNPGAWMDGLRYAVATDSSVELRHYR
jgi:UDP-2,3-diacylglucosamine hydrolase